jgi:hypothetical protein
MLDNIEYIEINKTKVMLSTFFIPLAAPLFLIFSAIFRDNGLANFDLGELLATIFVSLIFGAIIWIPTVMVILLLEVILIRKSANKKSVIFVLILEATIAFVTIWAVFGFSLNPNIELPLALAACIIIPQLFRWIYLKSKSRMYNSVEPKGVLDKI